MLLRAVGPTLGEFGLQGTLADPKLEMYTGSVRSAANDQWSASGLLRSDFTAVGAFPLPDRSRDAALRLPVSGGRSLQIVGADGGSGIALVELYDAGGGDGRLVNVSARAEVGTGSEILAAGFAIAGSAPKRILVRAVGPTLARYGVDGVLLDPVLEIRPLGSATLAGANDDWNGTASLKTAFAAVGAFPLDADASRDAALAVELPPGAYTATVSGKGNTTGVALVEIYELP